MRTSASPPPPHFAPTATSPPPCGATPDQRPDGTTAAERFFGHPPADLFEFLLDHIKLPSRPATRQAVPTTDRKAAA
jgi:hypothetical protein